MKKPLVLSNRKVEGTVRATMSGWQEKMRRKAGRGSTTPGKLKGTNCQASNIDRIMAGRNRSYKLPNYDHWCMRKTGFKG